MAAVVSVIFGADTTQLDAAMGRVNQSTGRLQKTFGALRHAAPFAAMAIGVNVFKGAVGDWRDEREATKQLAASLESMGRTDISTDELTKWASEMELASDFTDSAIINTTAVLATFGGIASDQLTAVGQIALDMAAKFDQGPKESAIQLGKALQEPIEGIGALRRIGVQLSEQQEQQIRDFVAVGDIASAQGIIMQEVSRQTAGAAAAEQDAFEKLKDVFDNMAENLAEFLLPKLEVLADIMEDIPGPVYLAVTAVAALALAVKGLWAALTLLSAHPIVAAVIAIGIAVVALEVKFGFLGKTVRAIRSSIQSLGAALSSVGRKIQNIRGGPGGLVGMFRGFHGGGIVPGPSTQQHLAVLRGGERVLPHGGGGGGGGVVVNVAGSVVTERDLIEAVRRGLVRSGSLPSRGRF